MMDVEALLMAVNIVAQLSTPLAVVGRQRTMGSQDDLASTPTPLCCGGPFSGYQPLGTSDFREHTTMANVQGNRHPMAACYILIPFVDTPLSSPQHVRGFMNTPLNDLLTQYNQPKKVSVGRQTLPMWESQPPLTPAFPPPTPMTSRNLAHFAAGQQMQTLNGTVQIYFSDCMICDKLYEQIADEIVIDYIHHTEYPGEPYYIKEGFDRRYACRYLLP